MRTTPLAVSMARQQKLNIESYVNDLIQGILAEPEPRAEQQPGPLDAAVRGCVIELWSDASGHLFMVADEEDARRLGEPRGSVYTADEVRRVIKIGDPAVVREIHEWKRQFNGRMRE